MVDSPEAASTAGAEGRRHGQRVILFVVGASSSSRARRWIPEPRATRHRTSPRRSAEPTRCTSPSASPSSVSSASAASPHVRTSPGHHNDPNDHRPGRGRAGRARRGQVACPRREAAEADAPGARPPSSRATELPEGVHDGAAAPNPGTGDDDRARRLHAAEGYRVIARQPRCEPPDGWASVTQDRRDSSLPHGALTRAG
jgi:hypothetical protein